MQRAKIAKICVRLIKTGGSEAKKREIVAVNSSFHRPSAQIFQFTSNTRGSNDRRKFAQQVSNAHNLGKNSPIVTSGAWYHDAAIKDDDRGRKG